MFEYRILRNARSRRLRLAVKHDGSVVVTIPRRTPLAFARAFVTAKRAWVESRIQQAIATQPKYPSYTSSKEAARVQLTALVERYARAHNFSYSKITIRNQSSRWGSCSRSGTISLRYSIIFLPIALQEYIIVHELCHLREMNHGPKFWALVKSILPDYTERRKALRSIERI
jgi:predicted metal-dependent hydrolase